MKHLVSGGSEADFFRFAQWLQMYPHPNVTTDIALGEEKLDRIMKDWISSNWQSRKDDARMQQPVIHSMLHCAVDAAQKFIPECGEYYVISDPSVVPGKDNRLSDEAVVEVIAQRGLFRILFELKGSKKVALPFANRSTELPFSQLLQQVGLALESKLWKNEILAGLVTCKLWYLFVIQDISSGSATKFRIQSAHYFEIPYASNVADNQWLLNALRFLAQYLCTHSVQK